jgi:hypothetical protein
LYGGKLPLNFSCHGTSVTPTFPTVASGAAAILPVAASAATCWTVPMLIIEVSLSGRPQLGLTQAPSGASGGPGMTTGPASSMTATPRSVNSSSPQRPRRLRSEPQVHVEHPDLSQGAVHREVHVVGPEQDPSVVGHERQRPLVVPALDGHVLQRHVGGPEVHHARRGDAELAAADVAEQLTGGPQLQPAGRLERGHQVPLIVGRGVHVDPYPKALRHFGVEGDAPGRRLQRPGLVSGQGRPGRHHGGQR